MIQDMVSYGDKCSYWMSMLSFQALLSSLEFLVLAQSWVGSAGCVLAFGHGAGVLLIPYWEHWWARGSCTQVVGPCPAELGTREQKYLWHR